MKRLELLPRFVVGGLVLGAIGVMLYGVVARYIFLPIADWLDVDPINFFWVEEVGETALAWITVPFDVVTCQKPPVVDCRACTCSPR